jgi:hypothetical protein
MENSASKGRKCVIITGGLRRKARYLTRFPAGNAPISFADRFMPFTAFFAPFAVLLSKEPNTEITFVI